MEDFLKFLLVAGVIVVGLVKQFKKEAQKNANKRSPMPMPEEAEVPLPKNWDETFGETMEQKSTAQSKKKKETSIFNSSQSTSFVPNNSTGTKSHTNSTQQFISPPDPDQPESEESEFAIQSAEEARRAIVWSEILRRKY